jgi:hypothetical protein
MKKIELVYYNYSHIQFYGTSTTSKCIKFTEETMDKKGKEEKNSSSTQAK